MLSSTADFLINVSRYGARLADFAAVVVHRTTEVHLATWLGKLLPADTLVGLDFRDSLDVFILETLVKIPLPFRGPRARVIGGALIGWPIWLKIWGQSKVPE